MMKKFRGIALVAAFGLLAAAPSGAFAGDSLSDMLSGKSAMKGKKLQKAIEKADAHPLGSEQNPVRVEMPPGQIAYLRSLRCSDGKPPRFGRVGNFGIGIFGSIVDGYDVRCEGSEPAQTMVYMDMYHAGHIESRPVPGFTIGTD